MDVQKGKKSEAPQILVTTVRTDHVDSSWDIGLR